MTAIQVLLIKCMLAVHCKECSAVTFKRYFPFKQCKKVASEFVQLACPHNEDIHSGPMYSRNHQQWTKADPTLHRAQDMSLYGWIQQVSLVPSRWQ